MVYVAERNQQMLSESIRGEIQFCLAPSRQYLAALEKCGGDPRIVESNPKLSTGRVPYHLCPPYGWK